MSDQTKFSILMGRKSIRLAFLLFAGVLLSIFLPGCQKQTPEETNRAFEKFTNELFCQETASNTVSLHYTLRNPEEFGIRETPVTFGTFETDQNMALVSVENIRRAMEEFDPENLSVTNRLTFDVLDYYMERLKENAEFTLYEEPLGLVSGIHTQLPVLLSEYQFYDREDVDIYLELMKITPDYFQSLIAFEQAKSDAGLFMSDAAALQVIEQCKVFMNMGESNYLITTFVDRIEQVKGLSEKEKSIYIQRNALMLSSYVLPAYSKLSTSVQTLMGTGVNEQGLCYFPEGKEYYEQVVKVSTGSERSVPEMKDLTKRQIVEDLEAMERVLGITENESMRNMVQKGRNAQEEGTAVQDEKAAEENVSQEAAALIGNPEQAHEAAAMDTTNPVSILNGLKKEIAKTFPTAPDTTVSVKYVPEALQGNLSPAFYMIPAIDSYEENVIYVNQAHMGNPLTLFTTLAHEGFPGHLYQNVYYAGTDPDPVRSMFNTGGYVEGWATYAEMCSYYLAPITKEQATILQKNSSIILGLYTLADIGIHYDGWSRVDTLAFFSNYGIQDVNTVNRIYDLVLGSPGNYAKYYIGYVEFLELKKEYAAKKGTGFSQKEFHKDVLMTGPAPFELVEKYMGKCEEK
ncbi:DUF885 domain-containing protein [Lachnospiraceae bacterium]|nr:DUF885 domain-containing protein [Ruminococcus sp.]NBI61050.1 DUF885 domain-containing protein [Lachnospiraceae bacterium]